MSIRSIKASILHSHNVGRSSKRSSLRRHPVLSAVLYLYQFFFSCSNFNFVRPICVDFIWFFSFDFFCFSRPFYVKLKASFSFLSNLCRFNSIFFLSILSSKLFTFHSLFFSLFSSILCQIKKFSCSS